jgi:hypothetical protein
MSRRYRSKSYNGRGLVSIASYLIRQFCFPNPFSNIVKDPNMATIVNWICGGIFIPLAYALTHTWYNGGAKSIGSFGFFINYAILTGLFLLITKFITNLYLVAFLFILGYVILCIVESKLFGEKHTF